MALKKYELTSEIAYSPEGKLYRIRALVNIPEYGVKPGDLGGFIQNERNLAHIGKAWVANEACVFGNAVVSENAYISGKARVYKNAIVKGNAIIADKAKAHGNSMIYDNAIVKDKAVIYCNALVFGNSKVFGNSRIASNAVLYLDAQVYGKDEVYDKTITKDLLKQIEDEKIASEIRHQLFLESPDGKAYIKEMKMREDKIKRDEEKRTKAASTKKYRTTYRDTGADNGFWDAAERGGRAWDDWAMANGRD